MGRFPLKIFTVKSATQFNPDLGTYLEYRVELWGDCSMSCNCFAGKFGRKCKHKSDKLSELVGEFGSIANAVEHYRQVKKDKYAEKIKENS
jgi:hypothetical protein